MIGDMIAQQSSGKDSGSQTASGNSEQLGLGQTLEEIPEEAGEQNSNSNSHSSTASADASRSAAAAPAPAAVAAAATMRLPQARAVPSGRQLLSRGKVSDVTSVLVLRLSVLIPFVCGVWCVCVLRT